MSRKIFIGMLVLEDKKAIKALGIEKNIENGELKDINTDGLSDDECNFLMQKSAKLLNNIYKNKQIGFDLRNLKEK